MAEDPKFTLIDNMRQNYKAIDELELNMEKLVGHLNDINMALKAVEARLKSINKNTKIINGLINSTNDTKH